MTTHRIQPGIYRCCDSFYRKLTVRIGEEGTAVTIERERGGRSLVRYAGGVAFWIQSSALKPDPAPV
jgi:hypothetical protein